IAKRFEKCLALMESEISVLQVEKRIRTRVKRQMEKTQREYYLNEQMKAIQKELGDEDDKDEMSELEERIKSTRLTNEAREKALAEVKKLRQMSPMSAEATVVRNYLDWLLSIPWQKRSKIKKDLPAAQTILDADHFGLDKVKERIVEYLADTLLDFVQPKMIGVQNRLRGREVLLDLRPLLPRDRQKPIKVIPDDRGFSRHRRHLPEFLDLGERLLSRFLGESRRLDTFLELGHLVLVVLVAK